MKTRIKKPNDSCLICFFRGLIMSSGEDVTIHMATSAWLIGAHLGKVPSLSDASALFKSRPVSAQAGRWLDAVRGNRVQCQLGHIQMIELGNILSQEPNLVGMGLHLIDWNLGTKVEVSVTKENLIRLTKRLAS